MSEHYAWVCNMLKFEFRSMSLEVPECLTKDTPVVIASSLHSAGEHYDETAFEPVAKWDNSLPGYPRTLPHVFNCNGFTVISAKARDVFLAHEMGSATFRQLRLYESDGVTLYSDQLYLLNLGNQKTAVMVEESPRLRSNSYSRDGFPKYLPFSEQRADDDVVLTAAAMEGPDLWTDPVLSGAIFFSDSLHDAMCRARIDKPFRLTLCLVKA